MVPIFNEAESLSRFNHEMNQFLEQSPVSTSVLHHHVEGDWIIYY